MLRNDLRVVKLFCFREWYRVFFYSPVVDLRVWKTIQTQLLLPGPGKDAVESCAESDIKNVDTFTGVMEQVLQPIFDVYVLSLGVCSVAGVVCFVVTGKLQCGAAVSACGYVVFHLCAQVFLVVLVCIAKLGIIV